MTERILPFPAVDTIIEVTKQNFTQLSSTKPVVRVILERSLQPRWVAIDPEEKRGYIIFLDGVPAGAELSASPFNIRITRVTNTCGFAKISADSVG